MRPKRYFPGYFEKCKYNGFPSVARKDRRKTVILTCKLTNTIAGLGLPRNDDTLPKSVREVIVFQVAACVALTIIVNGTSACSWAQLSRIEAPWLLPPPESQSPCITTAHLGLGLGLGRSHTLNHSFPDFPGRARESMSPVKTGVQIMTLADEARQIECPQLNLLEALPRRPSST